MGTPNYVARRSAWAGVTFLRVLFFFLIIPLIVMIFDIIIKKHDYIEFYDDYILQHSGWLSRREKRSIFAGVLSVSVNQSVWQRLCKYGDVHVDVTGKWDINTHDVANPDGLQRYLETRMVHSNKINHLIVE